jgi:hypothetical protein
LKLGPIDLNSLDSATFDPILARSASE